jgi:hypothetical protein
MKSPPTPILLRVPADLVAAIDDWHHGHRHASRTAAILAMLGAAATANKLGIVKQGHLHFSSKNKNLKAGE